jgi:hypothetical protein
LNQNAILKEPPASLSSQRELDTHLYSLPILVGIELKYAYMGYGKTHKDLQNDYAKLSNTSLLKFKLALCFFQSSREEKYFDDKMTTSGVSAKTVESIQELDNAYAIGPERIRVVNLT